MAPANTVTSVEYGNFLFENAMKGKWDKVVEICTNDPLALVAGITRFEDTLLHLAVSDGQAEETVRKLITIIEDNLPFPKMLLTAKNERGNTALHIAALMGSEAMCKLIASVDTSLIGERNIDGETPLFTAVRFGKKQAFLCLYDLCPSDERYSCSRNKSGDTILHCAISGDHFDLALRIINLYGELLLNPVNEDGITPLHLLADKPSAFLSGSRLGVFKQIIYNCIYVDEHKVMEPDDHFHKRSMQPILKANDHQRINSNHPEHFRTCNDFYRLFWNFFTFLRFAILGINVGVQTDVENPQTHEAATQESKATIAERRRFFPANYDVCCNFLQLVNKMVLIVLGGGFPTLRKIYEEKQQHKLSIQIMNKLLHGANMSEYYHAGKMSSKPSDKGKDTGGMRKDLEDPIDAIDIDASALDSAEAENGSKEGHDVGAGFSGDIEIYTKHADGNFLGFEAQASIQKINSTGAGGKKIAVKKNDQQETAILIAARNGVYEIVEKILELVPVAINDVNAENKNAVLLAVENRQPHIFKLFLERTSILNRDSVFRVVDKKGNSAFHLAAKLAAYKPWLIPGEALQMQWEMKWFEFVTMSIPSNFVPRLNKKGKTPEEVFIKSHKSLVKKGGEWLTNTSQSYSVVAALIATVAFATSTTVPGGIKEDTGIPTLENRPAFHLFAISSLVALCFSVTALVMFLSILTSRHQERDFGKDLPMKLLVGLTSLFISIAAVLISFCSGHFFVIQNKLRYVAFAVYAATCLPVTIFAAVQFPLYFDLIHASFTEVPRRSYKATI